MLDPPPTAQPRENRLGDQRAIAHAELAVRAKERAQLCVGRRAKRQDLRDRGAEQRQLVGSDGQVSEQTSGRSLVRGGW
jgi:hypothetical protein